MVRSSGLRGFTALVERLGHDGQALLEQHGLSAQDWRDEDRLLPALLMVNLMEAAARATGAGDFGLRLAATQDITVLGPLAVAMQHSPTVAAALDVLARYLHVQSPGLAMSVRASSDAGCSELRLDIALPSSPPARQVIDQGLGILHQALRLLCGKRYVLKAVLLPHSSLVPLQAYRRFYGAPVVTRQAYAALVFESAGLDAVLDESRESLRRMALQHLDQSYRNSQRRLQDRVRLAISSHLGSLPISRHEVARLLAIHPRTLQRRLIREGASFDTIREDVRRSLALKYLGDPNMPLIKVTEALGLSQQSALSRSCRRWFGKSPKQVRADLQAHDGGR